MEDMAVTICAFQKALAAVKKALAHGKMSLDEHQMVVRNLLELTRLYQFVNGAFKTTLSEASRDYFKVLSEGAAAEHNQAEAEVVAPIFGSFPAEVVETAPAAPPPAAPPAQGADFGTSVESNSLPPAKQSVFICKKCSASYEHFPSTGKCACGHGAFKTVDVPNPTPEHKAFCQEMEKDLAAKPVIPLQPAPVSAPAILPEKAAKAAEPLKTLPESGIISVLNKDIWACDNAGCGSDDLLHEVPVPPADKHQIGSRYQCLKCGCIGNILLQYEELVKLRGSSQAVAFKIGKDDYKQLVKWRDSPVPSERAVKAEPTPVAVVIPAVSAAPEQVSSVSGTEQQGTAAPARKRGRPKKILEVPAQAPESFPGAAVSSGNAGQAQVQAQAPSPSIVDLVTKIAGYEAPPINTEALTKELQEQIAVWPMDKLLKEAEALTGKVIDPAKMQIPSDKNLRQVLEETVIAEMICKVGGAV